MAKDLEKLLAEIFVPDMEYSPTYDKEKVKHKIKSVTIDEVPEVVLPKTKAEVYEEAKGRLSQKTSAVSRRAGKPDAAGETAATKPKTVRRKAPEPETHVIDFGVSPVADPVWVGSADELIPFAWRHPLIPDIARPSKYYRTVIREAHELLLPAIHNK